MSQETLPTVTKTWLQKRFNEGALVATVLKEVNETLPEDAQLSELKFKEGLKRLNISLRKKPRPATVLFVDDTIEAPVDVKVSDKAVNDLVPEIQDSVESTDVESTSAEQTSVDVTDNVEEAQAV